MLKPRRPRPIYAGRDKWRKAGADREKKGQEGERAERAARVAERRHHQNGVVTPGIELSFLPGVTTGVGTNYQDM